MTHNKIDFQKLQDGLQHVKSIDDLLGRDGLLTDVFKGLTQELMEAELTHHLGYPKGVRELKHTSNKRNGHSTKKLSTSMGDTHIAVPRDRDGEFEPRILEKHQSRTNELENKVISMYAKGMTVSDINEHLAEMYGVAVDDTMVSQMTNKILPLVTEWQNRPLEAIYTITFLDAIHFKVREDGKVKSKAAYVVYGINREGMPDILGIWVGESEGAKFWLTVLTEMQSRGVQDMLIVCSDDLSGLSEAIKSVYPQAIIQKCVVHQIRNSLKYIASQDQKDFLKDLKTVYQATSKDESELKLLELDETWGKKYPIVLKSWNNKWDELSQYFQFSAGIRKLIYTTNRIEGFNRQLRKVTKNKSVFPSDGSLMKMLFLVTRDITRKWTMPIQNWAQIIAQLSIHFPERLQLEI